ncbi:MAG: type II secretion system protein GspD [Gemmatimonadaceae bacterium]
MTRFGVVGVWFATLAFVPVCGEAQQRDSVIIRLINTELRAAVQTLSQYLDRPVLFSGQGGQQVTIETPQPVPRANVVRLLRGLLESQNYELLDDSLAGLYRARPREAPRAPPQASVESQAARQAGSLELFVVTLKHARAMDVAATINALYGRSTPILDQQTRPTIGEELRANLVPRIGAPPPAVVGTQRPAALTGEMIIVPDGRANSLLIRANRNDFELIRAVVQQVDIPALQVLIEAIVVEAQRDRSFSLSTEWKLGPTQINDIGTTISGVGGTAGLADFAIKVMGLGAIDLDAILRVASSRGDVRIVSRPVVLTENNNEANIVVGSQRPFVQVARSLPTDAPLRDQVVQYKEVGTKLSVRPTISNDGTVQLVVMQEVSNATGETQFDAPVISQRSVQTQLVVRDGQTVVLGGLTDKQTDVASGGVPLFSSIPVIGGLFGRWNRRATETELFVFLTPHVIRNEADAERLSRPLRERAQQVKP